MAKLYVQYGCGYSAPIEWSNYDISPTLRVQKLPVLGQFFKNFMNIKFPDNVLFGDIIKGLPIEDNSCDGLYCSHTLEHLSLSALKIALNNSYKVLKKGGVFRCIVPDLEYAARLYINDLDKGTNDASINFMKSTLLGVENRPTGLKNLLSALFGNANHLWMWDYKSLSEELNKIGFVNIRKCAFNDSEDIMFKQVESIGRFENAVAIECKK